SEGTLASITEARLDITPLPQVRRLLNAKHASLHSAPRHAPLRAGAQALSVETAESKLLHLAPDHLVWPSVSLLIPHVPLHITLEPNLAAFACHYAPLID
ncbi:FAD-binding oxidoreductase, partial [Escherichia coli]|uniref:FAD-binding oxidoreductase n=1 Tax=Escherichia coli TaxID=562 RepID=UPI001BC84370